MTICHPSPFQRSRIHGWLADRQGCGYYRIKVPLDALARTGEAQVVYSDKLDVRTLVPGQVVVGQRSCHTGPTQLWRNLRGHVRRVYEIDDDLLGIDEKNPQARAFFDDEQRRANILSNLRTADAVTVSTPYLAQRAVEYGADPALVHIVPNCLDPAVFDLPRPQTDRLTIGWGGSATHLGDFEVAARHLRRFFSRHPEIRMRYMGVEHNTLVWARIAEFAPWTPIFANPAGYYSMLRFDIGIAPLSDHPFNRSKSHLKALEYAAMGIPVVASDSPAYRDFVRHGETGFLVRREHEWERYLHELATDDALRERMGEAAREHARQYTIDRHLQRWREAYWPRDYQSR